MYDICVYFIIIYIFQFQIKQNEIATQNMKSMEQLQYLKIFLKIFTAFTDDFIIKKQRINTYKQFKGIWEFTIMLQ